MDLFSLNAMIACLEDILTKHPSSRSNFDQSLRSRDPEWGVRDLENVVEEAEAYGLTLNDRIEMPANNVSVIFIKR